MPLTPLPHSLAKVVATVGPASRDPAVLRALIDAGASVLRLNLSHGTIDEHAVTLAGIRSAAKDALTPVAVLGDLPGPKIRVGQCGDDGVRLAPGQELVIDPSCGSPREADGAPVVGCSYTGIGQDVKPGERVLIGDGAVRLRAVAPRTGDAPGVLRCVLDDGEVAAVVHTRKGINLPDSTVRLSSMTDRDWELAAWCVGAGVDLLALSFVRSAADVRTLQARLAGMTSAAQRADDDGDDAPVGEPSDIPVIAKIETPQAVAAMDEIVRQADGIMVARGDLGVEMDPWDVPVIQRRLIEAADAWGKPCIVATQMLESMIGAPLPTRAEAGDVATAVMDEADAVMLSGETAVGRYPVEAVSVMRRIIHAAEQYTESRRTEPTPPRHLVEAGNRTAALAHGAWYVANDVGACLVVCWSQHGGLARYLSQTGFSVPIVAYSSSVRHARRMALYRGVRPVVGRVPDDPLSSLAAWNDAVDELILSRGWAREGEPIVLIAGKPLGMAQVAGTIAVHYVGNPGTGFRAHG